MLVQQLVLLALVNAAAFAATGPILARLPEPQGEDADGKRLYASLGTPRFMAFMTLATAAATAVSVTFAPPAAWLPWLVYATLGSLAIAVDAATTWIPKALTTPLAVGVGVGVLVQAAITQDAHVLLRGAIGSLALGGFFYAFWWVTRGGIGFADVRLAFVIGLLAGSYSLQLALRGALIGVLLGAAWGLIHQWRRGRGEFAYGPPLWAGPIVALALGLG